MTEPSCRECPLALLCLAGAIGTCSDCGGAYLWGLSDYEGIPTFTRVYPKCPPPKSGEPRGGGYFMRCGCDIIGWLPWKKEDKDG